MNKFEYLKGVFASGLKPRARLVLQSLIYHADKDGFCFPSIKTIATECGYSLSTVKRALNELCEAGYIEKTARFDDRKNGGQTSNLYMLSEASISDEQKTDNTACEKTEIIPEEPASTSENTTEIEYSYTFSNGLTKLLKENKNHAFNGWSGGQSIFIPP